MAVLYLLTNLTGINELIAPNFNKMTKEADSSLNQIIKDIPKGESITVTGNNLVLPHLVSNWDAYNDTKGMLLKNEFDSFAKIDYNLNNRNYLQSEARAEYNQLGKYKEKVVFGIGHGYRLIHTNKAKLSFETSAGITEAKGLSEFVVRESVWASYQFSANTHVDDKFLIEHGKSHDYIRNKASAVLDLSNHVFVSVTNIYTDDYTISKITSFNIGYKF